LRGSTHLIAGAALGVMAGSLVGGPAELVAGGVVGGLGGIISDVDHPGSMAGRWLRPVAVWLEERSHHRDSLTHTFWFCAAAGFFLGYIAWILTGEPVLIAAGVLACLSHLVLDGMTRSGVRPFRVWLPRLKLRNLRHGDKAFPGTKASWLNWNRFVDKVEYWTGRRFRGRFYTGKSPVEPLIEIASLLVIAAVGYFELSPFIFNGDNLEIYRTLAKLFG